MKMNPAGLALLKEFEGCRLTAYKDPVGIWTIGWGLTTAAGIVPVKEGMRITQEMADEYLVRALVQYEQGVAKLLERVPTSNQFSAMVSLAYNIGVGNFGKSLVLTKFNAGDIAGAAAAFNNWTKGGGKVLSGLVRRRKAEEALFLKPDIAAVPPAPSPPVPIPAPPKEYQKPSIQTVMGGLLAAGLVALVGFFVNQCSGGG